MIGGNMNPIEKVFNEYCAKYPVLSRDAIVDLMIKECKDLEITPEIAKALKEGKSLFLLDNKIEKTPKQQYINMTEIFGGDFKSQKTQFQTFIYCFSRHFHYYFIHYCLYGL